MIQERKTFLFSLKLSFLTPLKETNPFKTYELINQIQILDNQLAPMRNRAKYQVSFYQQRIEELKANSSYAFEYITEI